MATNQINKQETLTKSNLPIEVREYILTKIDHNMNDERIIKLVKKNFDIEGLEVENFVHYTVDIDHFDKED